MHLDTNIGGGRLIGMNKKAYGFTIVELLIVIVVIGILAAVSIVAYSGIQGRARDSQRLQDIATIRKALEMYKTEQGRYPVPVANPGVNNWEASVDPNFLQSLQGYISKAPVDPMNKIIPPHGAYVMGHYYAYYRYGAGENGCPVSLGAFYVLRIVGLEATDGRAVSDLGKYVTCTGSQPASRIPTQTQAVFISFEG